MASTMTSDEHEHDHDESTEGNEGDEDSKNRKRKERLEQNRISARESRKRKKTMIEELQRTVITLSRENKDLNERNEQLRRQLMEIGGKYPNIVSLQAIVGQAQAQASAQDNSNANTGAAGQSSTAPAPGMMSSFNPMSWFPAGGNAPNNNQANV